MKTVLIGSVPFANNHPLALIAGPCAIEGLAHALDMAGALKEICAALGIGFVYKSSFDKANRTAAGAGRGIGMDKGLEILAQVKRQIGVPVITDVHLPDQCAVVAKSVDALQIPAFLCRQTDLLLAAKATGLPVNVKKGQFLAPWDMVHVAAKLGDTNVMLCERGSSFGYNTLVVDMRGLSIMAATGHPVIFDATHSVQQPGGKGASTGGDREMAKVLARAAVAVGVAGVFIETHQNPDTAPSDGPNMIKLADMRGLLEDLMALDALTKAQNARRIAG